MTGMTPERLAEIRDRASYGISHHSLADRRDLLAEVDRLQALADLRMDRAIDAAMSADRAAAKLDAIDALVTARPKSHEVQSPQAQFVLLRADIRRVLTADEVTT